jgi:hypothetical protein
MYACALVLKAERQGFIHAINLLARRVGHIAPHAGAQPPVVGYVPFEFCGQNYVTQQYEDSRETHLTARRAREPPGL